MYYFVPSVHYSSRMSDQSCNSNTKVENQELFLLFLFELELFFIYSLLFSLSLEMDCYRLLCPWKQEDECVWTGPVKMPKWGCSNSVTAGVLQACTVNCSQFHIAFKWVLVDFPMSFVAALWFAARKHQAFIRDIFLFSISKIST